MVNYSNGKIYKITGGGMTYYGSTTQPLNKRLAVHRNLNCSSKIIIETGKYDICLVEEFKCENKEQLHARERFYIENNECINKRIPSRTKKEYYEDNKEQIKEIKKKYYEDKKEQIKDQRKEYYEDNKKIRKEQMKEYYEKNKEKLKEKQKEYYEKNKLK